MKWLLCFQTPYNRVRYFTNEQQQIANLSYNDFLKFSAKLKLKNSEKFINTLNNFQTIFVNIEEQKWEIYSKSDSNISFEEMLKLNKDKAKVTNLFEDSKQKENKSYFEVNKNFINNFFNKRKEKFFK